jgi:hypothetical protein
MYDKLRKNWLSLFSLLRRKFKFLLSRDKCELNVESLWLYNWSLLLSTTFHSFVCPHLPLEDENLTAWTQRDIRTTKRRHLISNAFFFAIAREHPVLPI